MENKVAALGYPYKENMSFLAEQGVKTLINLHDRGRPDYAETAEALGIKLVSIPITDFTPPTLQQIKEFLQILASASDVSVCDKPQTATPPLPGFGW